ncbi:hypothetical protein EVAR_89671_1 [Eumeta japonica]|uniref:Uncharacterized protein n=1 Tax=Eumeta variegata TaxID=151549 RepID=A0A4C1YE10_EUMVA|nr:hypothetical protein EVAR_89671_1 [Eumeta japonica]
MSSITSAVITSGTDGRIPEGQGEQLTGPFDSIRLLDDYRRPFPVIPIHELIVSVLLKHKACSNMLSRAGYSVSSLKVLDTLELYYGLQSAKWFKTIATNDVRSDAEFNDLEIITHPPKSRNPMRREIKYKIKKQFCKVNTHRRAPAGSRRTRQFLRVSIRVVSHAECLELDEVFLSSFVGLTTFLQPSNVSSISDVKRTTRPVFAADTPARGRGRPGYVWIFDTYQLS